MKPTIRFMAWVTAAVLGCFLLGGCDQSAVEKAPLSDSNGFWIPVTVDPDLPDGMAVGDGSGAAIAYFDGHVVGLSNAAPCSGPPTAITCTIKITNLDPDYYMANVFMLTSWCADCAGDKFFSNADLARQDGVTVTMVPDPGCTADSALGYCGHLEDINGAGFCVVEDGSYDPYPEPYNYYGCGLNFMGFPFDAWKPKQFIHPDCGAESTRWDFSTATGESFHFWMSIEAQWFPEIPYGPDGLRGTGDDDSRFDFNNRTTLMLTLNTLNDDLIPGAVNKQWWRIGSYKRSQALTGYGSGGADFTPAEPGAFGPTYFALNVLAEYPDRIEGYSGAGYAGDLFSDYEYYTYWAWVIRYDPTVVQAVSTTGGMCKFCTVVYAGGLDPCVKESGYCAAQNTSAFTGYDGIGSTTTIGGSAEAAGYLYSYNAITPVPFAWNFAGQTYQTTNGDNIVGGYSDLFPINAGVKGLVKVSMVPHPSFTNTVWYSSTAIVPSGTPDPEPEIGLGMYYFKLLPGTSGRGTGFYADQWLTECGPSIAWTNGTAAGGYVGGLDDWLTPCFPAQPGYEDDTNQGCDDSLGVESYWVYHGYEVSNPQIHHSGPSVPGGGAYQYWNVHLCVL